MNTISRIVGEVHNELSTVADGVVADYIPELAKVDPDVFGIALTTPDGHSHLVGDVDVPFSIQSVSKAFVYALVLDAVGTEATEARVDLEPSGEAFNEISLDPETSKPMNAMINAGAIAVTGLTPGKKPKKRFEWIRAGLSAFANRELGFDEAIYDSELSTGHRNRAIAYLLRNGGVLGDHVDEDLDLYFRQCSLLVTVADLAVMGATLANGGINPLSGERVVRDRSAERVLSVMSSSGMYNASGTWIARVGLPAKSGVGGGVVAVLPGEIGLAVHSPRLDEWGNSVRGIQACQQLSQRFNLHLFNSPTLAEHFVRRIYRLSDSGSTRQWSTKERDYLAMAGTSVAVIEVQGEVVFATAEKLSRVLDDLSLVQIVILDCSRLGQVDVQGCWLIGQIADDLATRGTQLFLADPNGRFDSVAEELGEHCQVVAELDVAVEGAELALLRASDLGHVPVSVELAACELFRGLTADALAVIEPYLEEIEVAEGEVLCRVGDASDALYVLTGGSLDVRSGPLSGGVRRARLAALGPGACVGEIGLVDGASRSADVVATSTATCRVLTRDDFDKIARERPDVHGHLLRNIMLLNLDRLRRSGARFANRRD